MENQWKSTFFRSAFLEISSVFSLIYLVFFPPKYSTCDTCDSKKHKTLVYCARTRAREENELWNSRFVTWSLQQATHECICV